MNSKGNNLIKNKLKKNMFVKKKIKMKTTQEEVTNEIPNAKQNKIDKIVQKKKIKEKKSPKRNFKGLNSVKQIDILNVIKRNKLKKEVLDIYKKTSLKTPKGNTRKTQIKSIRQIPKISKVRNYSKKNHNRKLTININSINQSSNKRVSVKLGESASGSNNLEPSVNNSKRIPPQIKINNNELKSIS